MIGFHSGFFLFYLPLVVRQEGKTEMSEFEKALKESHGVEVGNDNSINGRATRDIVRTLINSARAFETEVNRAQAESARQIAKCSSENAELSRTNNDLVRELAAVKAENVELKLKLKLSGPEFSDDQRQLLKIES